MERKVEPGGERGRPGGLADGSLDAIAGIRAFTRELVQFLDRPRPEAELPQSHGWASDLCRRLTDLHGKVSLQRRIEKETRLFRRLQRSHPRASARIDELRAEHERMLVAIRRLVTASMRYAEGKPPRDPRLRERTRELLERLEHHERLEVELLQELALTDVGGSD